MPLFFALRVENLDLLQGRQVALHDRVDLDDVRGVIAARLDQFLLLRSDRAGPAARAFSVA